MSRPAAAGARRAWRGRPVTGVERRQLLDLPAVAVQVTEHQLTERECGCGHRTRAAAPAGADGPVQYGPRIAAIVIYLYTGQFLSRKRTAQALAELSGVPLSQGTVAAVTGRAAGRPGGFLERAREEIAAGPVAGFDETGFRAEGKLHWVHCARTGRYTLLTVHPRRGTNAMAAMGVLPSFAGIAVHDAWARCDTYTAPEHQLCCAHALRELQAVTGCAPGGQWCWAAQAAEAITGMQKLVRGHPPGSCRRGPGCAGRLDPDLPLSGPDRGQPDRRPLWQADEKAQRPGPPITFKTWLCSNRNPQMHPCGALPSAAASEDSHPATAE